MPANGPTPGVLGSGARNGASGSNSSAGNVNLTEYDAQEDQDYSEMEAMVSTPEDLQNCCWFPDSGATNHVTHDLGILNSGTEYNGNSKIHMGNGTGLEISHIGLSFFPSYSSPNKVLLLKNILRVPAIKKNLLNVSQFARDNNVYFEFHPKVCFVKDRSNHSLLLQGTLHKGLYQFHLSKNLFGKASGLSLSNGQNELTCCTASLMHNVNSDLSVTTSSSFSVFDLWHKRLGHPTSKIVTQILNDNKIPFSTKSSSSICSACQLKKSHNLSFPISQTMYTKPLQLVVSDLWGPAPINSSYGFTYYVSFVDAYSRYTYVYFLKTKSQTRETFLGW